MTQPADRQVMGLVTSGKTRAIGVTRPPKKSRSDALDLAGARKWQEVYADRLERVISCYRTPEEQVHAARLEAETNRIVEEVKNEVALRGVDWHSVAPPRPVGVDSGGVVLAWDEPTWGAEIEIEIPHGGEPAKVFVWADHKVDLTQESVHGDTNDEPLEESQEDYRRRLIRLLCGESTT